MGIPLVVALDVFRTYMTCCYCIKQVTIFQGQSRILGSMPSHQGIMVAALMYASSVSTEGAVLGLVPELEQQLLGCQGLLMPYEVGSGRQ